MRFPQSKCVAVSGPVRIFKICPITTADSISEPVRVKLFE